MSDTESPLSALRRSSPLSIPERMTCLRTLSCKALSPLPTVDPKIAARFPSLAEKPILEFVQGPDRELPSLRVGVVFSGGQAPGGHNVVAGLFDAVTSHKGTLIGFLGGPSGITEGRHKEITEEELSRYRNQGGFDLLGSGRTKIETDKQLEEAFSVCRRLDLDGLVIIGGDDSNTNAALLADFFHRKKGKTQVVGVPKTIDGDLQNDFVPISFGFDTACKVYSELIGNLAKDALSDKKYYHIVKLMGRTASHVTLECALTTHPNHALISEEVFAQKKTLSELASELADLVIERFQIDKSYGVILIPEGLLEWVPEVRLLISELNELLVANNSPSAEDILPLLTVEAKKCFSSMPQAIQEQLLSVRDPHGNIHVSSVETDKLLMEMTKKELKQRSFQGKFSPVPHFFGYEGRSAFPSNFDASYCYALGVGSFFLIASQAGGYMTYVSGLEKPSSAWRCGGVPLASLMHIERKNGVDKPVIRKALVELNDPAFLSFAKERETWKLQDCYRYPGPVQFWGDAAVSNGSPLTILLNTSKEVLS